MKKTILITLLLFLVATQSFARPGKRYIFMLGVGGAKMGGYGMKDTLLRSKKMTIADAMMVTKFNDYIGISAIGGYMYRDARDISRFSSTPVSHKFNTTYLGMGLYGSVPLSYVDIYASINMTYNMSRLKVKGVSSQSSNKVGYLINFGFNYALGQNAFVGLRYQFNSSNFKYKSSVVSLPNSSLDKDYKVPVQSIIGTLGFEF